MQTAQTYRGAALPDMADTIGPRGLSRITSDNRGDARRWLTATGLPSAFVRALTLAQIAAAYDDTSNRTLDALHVQAGIPEDEREGRTTEDHTTNTQKESQTIDSPISKPIAARAAVKRGGS